MYKAFLTLAFLVLSLIAQSQTSGTLTVTATTSKTSSPKYSPKNIVAIWIEDSNGNFVKTLLAYAGERKQYLKTWKSKTTLAGSAYNVVDAITGATQSLHAARTASWNGKNKSSILVDDGTYKLKMEVTDNDGTAQNLAEFSFVKGTSEQVLTPAATNGFSSITIKWSPLNTAVDEADANTTYRIFPTLATSTISVSGSEVESLEIFDMQGKLMLHSSEKVISVINLPGGVYLANINTIYGNYKQKFVKK